MAYTSAQLKTMLDAFIARWKGHGAISSCTGNHTPQCVDGIDFWSQALRKGCFPRGGNAKDMFRLADGTKWLKIRNTPSGKPLLGDVVVWAEHNGLGHVAICRGGATTSRIPTFDQNWSVAHRFTLESHKYLEENIVGWLRPK